MKVHRKITPPSVVMYAAGHFSPVGPSVGEACPDSPLAAACDCSMLSRTPIRDGFRSWGFCSVLGGLVAVSTLAAERTTDTRAGKGIAYPVYAAEASVPIAVVRVQSTRTEYQRRGFLRIGALPMLVAEQVRVEVRDPRATVAQLSGLPEWLRAPGKGRAGEVRDFQMFDPAEPARPWLSADRVRFAPNGQWEMTGVVVRGPGMASQPFGYALLQVTGERAGQVLLPDGRAVPLFTPALPGLPAADAAVTRPETATLGSLKGVTSPHPHIGRNPPNP